MSSNKDFGYTMETKASAQNLEHRELLYEMFKDRPMPDDQLLICLGLFMRSSALTKIMFVNEAYQLILNQPGVIVEFGTWWGQNIVQATNKCSPKSAKLVDVRVCTLRAIWSRARRLLLPILSANALLSVCAPDTRRLSLAPR